MKKYNEAVKNYKDIINSLKEIDSKDKNCGIYILYIDNLILDDILPIYVGQSVNLYNRRTSHRTNTKKLFELTKEQYNKTIPLNSGKYLYCKLVSMLKNNNKTLDDVKFKVLEYCDKDKLDDKESYWINYFETTIYGFNQFEEIIKSNKLTAEIFYTKDKTKIHYDDIVIRGAELLTKFKSKVEKFDKTLLKYKYYSTNYSLLLGNYNSLIRVLEKITTENFMEMEENIDDILIETEDYLKIKLRLFLNNNYIKIGPDMFKTFEIN